MQPKVFLAIPNYNMGIQLARLLDSVIGCGYDHIYVLDDCSTDNSRQVAERYKEHGTTFVSTDSNVGAAATRNRILEFQQEGIVHFLDADMELIDSDNTPSTIKAMFERHKDAAAAGFRVRNPDGTQFEWNFGPRRNIMDWFTYHSWEWHKKVKNRGLRKLLATMFKKQWGGWWTYMHTQDAEREHQVGAVVECNMAVRLEDFARVGGFDSHLRYHEIHDLAFKFKAIGKSIWYAPEVTAIKHNEIEVRVNRKHEIYSAARWLDFKRFTGQYRKTK